MLHAIAGENFSRPSSSSTGMLTVSSSAGDSQHFAQAFVQAQQFGGFVETRLGGNPRIGFLFRRRNRF